LAKIPTPEEKALAALHRLLADAGGPVADRGRLRASLADLPSKYPGSAAAWRASELLADLERDDRAAAALKPLEKRLSGRLEESDRSELRRDLVAFRVAHAGTPTACRVADLLAKLPSAPDRLQVEKVPEPWRSEGVVALIDATPAGATGTAVLSVTFSADCSTLAAGLGSQTDVLDHFVRLWDLSTGEPGPRELLSTRESYMTRLAFSPDGRRLCATGRDGTLIWNLAQKPGKGESIKAIREANFDRSGLFFSTYANDISTDASVVLSAANDNLLYKVDTLVKPASPHGSFLRPDQGPVRALALDPTGTKAITCTTGGTLSWHTSVILWSIAGEKPEVLTRFKSYPEALQISPDGFTLAMVFRSGLSLFDLRGCPPYAKYQSPMPEPKLPKFAEFSADIDAVAFAPDGRRLAVVDSQGRVTVWEVATGRKTYAATVSRRKDDLELRHFIGRIRACLAFTNDGRHLAVAAGGAEILIVRLSPIP
jgi:hypothetical protein